MVEREKMKLTLVENSRDREFSLTSDSPSLSFKKKVRFNSGCANVQDEEERSFLAASDLLQSRAELLATFDPDFQEVALNCYFSPKIYIRKTQLCIVTVCFQWEILGRRWRWRWEKR